MEVSGAAGPVRLDAERVRTTRFMRGPWWGGLDPQEVYGFLGWVAEELDLRAHELSQARAPAGGVARVRRAAGGAGAQPAARRRRGGAGDPRYGVKLIAQSAGHLDLDRRIGVRPDLTWRHGGRVVAVIDAKYKRQMPAADAYQMLAYCTAYGLTEGHLVYPTGGPLRRHVIRNANTNLICHFLDLGQDPAELLGAVDRTAEVIARYLR